MIFNENLSLFFTKKDTPLDRSNKYNFDYNLEKICNINHISKRSVVFMNQIHSNNISIVSNTKKIS